MIPVAILVASGFIACTYPYYKAAFEKYPHSSDKFKHCWVSCKISRTCGGYIAGFAGLAKEVRDRLISIVCEQFSDLGLCDGGHGDFWDSLDDIKANNQCIGLESHIAGALGGWIGSIFRDSCECCCSKKIGRKKG